MLPKNCIYYGVVEKLSQQQIECVVIERKACIRPYNHFGDIIEVGYPKLLFAYKIKGVQVVASAVVAAIDEFIKPRTPVYVFPYGNAFNNGSICMGTFHHPDVKPGDLTDVSFYPEVFYLIEHDQVKNQRKQEIKEILDKVTGKPFDNELLTVQCTFEQWVDRFSK